MSDWILRIFRRFDVASTTACASPPDDRATDREVSLVRLHVLRLMYLVMAVGLLLTIWPSIVSHRLSLPLMNGVVQAMLGTVGLLALVGLRYPLTMLPILLFELIWKAIWLLAFALPLWSNGLVDDRTASTVFDTSLGAVLLFVMPWGYVTRHYVTQPATRWR